MFSQYIDPGLERVLMFAVPLFIALATFVLNLNRGFSIPAMVIIAIFAGISIYYAPAFFALF